MFLLSATGLSLDVGDRLFIRVPDEMKVVYPYSVVTVLVKLYVCNCWKYCRLHVACVRNPVWKLSQCIII